MGTGTSNPPSAEEPVPFILGALKVSNGNMIEVIGACLALACSLFVPGCFSLVRLLIRPFKRFAQRRLLATVSVGIFATAASACLSLFVFHPEPAIHDEFSYLLAADTFAHGRLANPPHPMWEHFETFHVIHQPTYASKYPPTQGLMLAAGQVLAGRPLVGVWISVGLSCAAICWMLQGWLPPHWALLGAFLAMSRIVLLGPWVTIAYWSQSYWGGAVAALGGALVFGALPRILQECRVRHALILGVGLAVLANSRPFEGAVACLPVALVLGISMFPRSAPSYAHAMKRLLLPLFAILVPTAVLMGYYNLCVTGNPLRMPYQVHESAYAVAPSFVWQSLRPEPEYHHSLMQKFWTGWACESYLRQRTVAGLFEATAFKLYTLWRFFLGITLTIPLATLCFAIRDRWMGFAALTCGLVLLALCQETGVVPHYAAPITGLVYVLAIQSLRHLRLWRWRGRCTGIIFARGLAVAYIMLILSTIVDATRAAGGQVWFRERARIMHELTEAPGKHLVIVRYSPRHNGHAEWVYNEADIDRTKVAWARDMGENERLIDYFSDRQVWLLEADAQPPDLVPYAGELDHPSSTHDNAAQQAITVKRR
jgi:hypothetical protein